MHLQNMLALLGTTVLALFTSAASSRVLDEGTLRSNRNRDVVNAIGKYCQHKDLVRPVSSRASTNPR